MGKRTGIKLQAGISRVTLAMCLLSGKTMSQKVCSKMTWSVSKNQLGLWRRMQQSGGMCAYNQIQSQSMHKQPNLKSPGLCSCPQISEMMRQCSEWNGVSLTRESSAYMPCFVPVNIAFFVMTCNFLRRDSKAYGRAWAKRQVRPYPTDRGTWKGEVKVGQCFFEKLEDCNKRWRAEFGGWPALQSKQSGSGWKSMTS